jgi:hypothetical protein
MPQENDTQNTGNKDAAANVPQERPDPEAAGRPPGPDAVDRPGFDLGGAIRDAAPVGSNIIPDGPRDPLPASAEPGRRPTGHMHPGGSSSLRDEDRAGSEVGTAASDVQGGTD